MGEKNDGLGLSLGLGCGANQSSSSSSSFHLNLMQNASEANHNHRQHRIFGILGFSGTFFAFGIFVVCFSRQICFSVLSFPFIYIFATTDRNVTSFRSFRREIDVNQAPPVADFEDENGVSSPNSTVSSLSGKRSERETIGDENEAERTSCSLGGGSDDDDGNGGGDMSKKKLRLTKEQSLLLEDKFKEHHTLNTVSHNSVNFPNEQGYFCLSTFFILEWQFCYFVCCVLIFYNFFVSEAKAGTGTEAEPEPKTSGGVVSEQEGKVRNIFTESRVQLSFCSTTLLLIVSYQLLAQFSWCVHSMR